MAYLDKAIITTPYRDPASGQLIVTMAQTIFKSRSAKSILLYVFLALKITSCCPDNGNKNMYSKAADLLIGFEYWGSGELLARTYPPLKAGEILRHQAELKNG